MTQKYFLRISAMCTNDEVDLVSSYTCVLDEDKLKGFSLELAGELAMKSIKEFTEMAAQEGAPKSRPMTDEEIQDWRKENS